MEVQAGFGVLYAARGPDATADGKSSGRLGTATMHNVLASRGGKIWKSLMLLARGVAQCGMSFEEWSTCVVRHVSVAVMFVSRISWDVEVAIAVC